MESFSSAAEFASDLLSATSCKNVSVEQPAWPPTENFALVRVVSIKC